MDKVIARLELYHGNLAKWPFWQTRSLRDQLERELLELQAKHGGIIIQFYKDFEQTTVITLERDDQTHSRLSIPEWSASD